MSKMNRRYRSDKKGRILIELNLRHVNQLFDSRDPSPFLERDLDDNAVAYIVAAASEHSMRTPLGLVIHITEPDPLALEKETIVESVHNHFAYDAEQMRKKLRRILRQGQFSFLVGVCVLFACLTLSQSLKAFAGAQFISVLQEGLMIMGWVAMWRPIDIFLYSWWPQLEERRAYSKLSQMPVEVKFKNRVESVPASPLSSANALRPSIGIAY
jgi:hypothetical protein